MKKRLRRFECLIPCLQDPKWRAGVSLLIGFCINVGMAVFQFVSGCVYRSPWLIAAAIYYIVLSLTRAGLMKDVHSLSGQETDMGWKRIRGIKSYRLCGLMMFGLEVAMSGVVLQIVWQNHSYEYPGALIYLSALYAFYCLITAIIRVVRAKRTDPPELSAAKLLGVSKSLMSLLSMQTALLARFGEDETFRRVMNAATGCGVCLIVLGIAAYMVVRANRELTQLLNGEISPSNKI